VLNKLPKKDIETNIVVSFTNIHGFYNELNAFPSATVHMFVCFLSALLVSASQPQAHSPHITFRGGFVIVESYAPS
jgi:hypothetical protein